MDGHESSLVSRGAADSGRRARGSVRATTGTRDRSGRRLPGASVLRASALSIQWLIAARVAQSVGAALVVPISLALLNGTLRESDRARGIGVWAGLSTLVTTVGPYAGGWLVDHTSWRWVFLLPPPLIVLIAVAQLWLAQLQPGSGYIGTILPGAMVQGPGSSLADSVTDGYRPAMIAIGGICAAAAVLAGVFVSSERSACPYLAAPVPHHGCALPVIDSATMRPQPTNGGPMTFATARSDT